MGNKETIKKVIVNVMTMLIGKNKNSEIEPKEQGLQKHKRELLKL